VFRGACIAAVAGVLMTAGALPAAAAGGGAHTFSVPGVYGIEAWGSYQRAGAKLRITVCVEDNVRGVYGGAAAAVAYGGKNRQTVAAVTVGYRHLCASR
jgi:hypothetical protein